MSSSRVPWLLVPSAPYVRLPSTTISLHQGGGEGRDKDMSISLHQEGGEGWDRGGRYVRVCEGGGG